MAFIQSAANVSCKSQLTGSEACEGCGIVPNSAEGLSPHKDSVGINDQGFVKDHIFPLARVCFSEHDM